MSSRRLQPDLAALDPNDHRCDLRKITPKDGLTLRQAMLFYGDEQRVAEFLRREPYAEPGFHKADKRNALAFSIRGAHLRTDYEWLLKALLDKLATGALYATGYNAHSGLDERAHTIAPDRWRTLKADTDTSHASSPGLDVSGILVFKQRRKVAIAPAKPVASRSRIQNWYTKRVSDAEAAGLRYTRAEDEAASRHEFGIAPRSLLRELRRDLAPQDWLRRGRPKTGA